MRYQRALSYRKNIRKMKNSKLINFEELSEPFCEDIGQKPNYDTNIFISIGCNGKALFKTYIFPVFGDEDKFEPEANCRYTFKGLEKLLDYEILELRAYSCSDYIALVSHFDLDGLILEPVHYSRHFKWYMKPSSMPRGFNFTITDARFNQHLHDVIVSYDEKKEVWNYGILGDNLSDEGRKVYSLTENVKFKHFDGYEVEIS